MGPMKTSELRPHLETACGKMIRGTMELASGQYRVSWDDLETGYEDDGRFDPGVVWDVVEDYSDEHLF